MLSAPFMDNGIPSYGTIRVLAPLPEVLSNNLSHIHEAYQNLPQIGRPIILPLNYNSFQQQNRGYNNEFQIFSPYSSSFLMNRKSDYMSNRRNEDGNFNKRDGHGGGHGWGWDAGHGHQSKKSPALSALALLGFMFFLNLIQTSLQNNRQMLAAAAMNATGLRVVAAGRMRDKRSVPLQLTRTTLLPPILPPTLENRQWNSSTISSSKDGHVHFTSPITSQETGSMVNGSPIDSFKSASLQCLQLLSCKLAKYIFEDMDATTRVMLYILRGSIHSRVGSTQSWTGRMIRAFSDGLENRIKCENLYQECTLFNRRKLSYRTPRISRRRKKKL